MKNRVVFEIQRSLATLLSELLEDTAFFGSSKEREWYPGTLVENFFTQLAKKGSPVLRKQAGRAFAGILLAEMERCYEWASIREALVYLPRVYSHFVRGEGAGVWIHDELSDGFANIRENTPFDCFFTEGMLAGFLVGLDAKGVMVRHPECRKDSENGKFCRYGIVWMKRIVR